MKIVVVTLATLVAAAAPAMAQPGVTEPQPLPQPMQPRMQVEGDQLDEGTALGLSLGGTVASWAMLIVAGETDNSTMANVGAIGTMFAPSLGHWYAHHYFSRGLGLRIVGTGAAMVGLAMAIGDIFDDQSNHDDFTPGLLMLAGVGLYIGGTLDDIATAPRAVRDYNSRFENVQLVPVINQNGGGMSLVGRF